WAKPEPACRQWGLELLGETEEPHSQNRRGAQAGKGQGRRAGPGTLWQDRQSPQQARSIWPHRRTAGDDGPEQRPESISRPVSESRWAMIATVDSVQVQPPAQTTLKAKVNPIETLQKTVSASRLTTFLQCRLKFYFRYVQQISKPKTPSLHVGSVVHLILQAWNMARWRKQEFQLDKFKKLFEDGWKDQPPGIKWDGEEAGEKNTAWSVLEMYFAQTPIKANERPEAVEV